VDAHRPAVWHGPALAAPGRGLRRALAGGGLAAGADSAGGVAGRALRAPPPPAALGVAGAPARARPHQPCGWVVLDANGAPRNHREGVLWHQPSQADWLFITTCRSAPRCSTGRARATPAPPHPPGSAPSTTPPAAPGCCWLCTKPEASMQPVAARRAADLAASPSRFAASASRGTKATRANGRWRFAGGWSGRFRRRGFPPVAWHERGVGGLGGQTG
jgi:hypothetical protein